MASLMLMLCAQVVPLSLVLESEMSAVWRRAASMRRLPTSAHTDTQTATTHSHAQVRWLLIHALRVAAHLTLCVPRSCDGGGGASAAEALGGEGSMLCITRSTRKSATAHAHAPDTCSCAYVVRTCTRAVLRAVCA